MPDESARNLNLRRFSLIWKVEKCVLLWLQGLKCIRLQLNYLEVDILQRRTIFYWKNVFCSCLFHKSPLNSGRNQAPLKFKVGDATLGSINCYSSIDYFNSLRESIVVRRVLNSSTNLGIQNVMEFNINSNPIWFFSSLTTTARLQIKYLRME